MSDVVAVLLLALLGSVVALAGGVMFLAVKPWSRFLARHAVPFAAGVLLTVAMVGLLPETAEVLGETAFGVVLVTFLGAYVFEYLVCELHHHDEGGGHDGSHVGAVSLVLVGDTIHNFIDGVAIAAAYLVNPGLGLITAISTFLHEVPHEMGDFGILLKAGWRRSRIFGINLVSALMTVVGAVGVFYLAESRELVGYLLAISAGMFLYLGASDFLPRADRDLPRGRAILILLLGVMLMYGTLAAVPHGHN